MTGPAWREKREAAGMTLRALAQRVGISPPFLSDVEHGRRRFSPGTEAKVREALGLGPASKPPGHRCIVCEAPLKARRGIAPTIHDPHGVIGPGYRPISQGYEYDDGFTCTGCGLHYDRAPAAPREGRGERFCACHDDGPPDATGRCETCLLPRKGWEPLGPVLDRASAEVATWPPGMKPKGDR